MLTWIIVGLVAATVFAGHLLLIRSAWQLRNTTATNNTPASTPYADLFWSIATAAATMAVLGWLVVDLLGTL